MTKNSNILSGFYEAENNNAVVNDRKDAESGCVVRNCKAQENPIDCIGDLDLLSKKMHIIIKFNRVILKSNSASYINLF